MSSSNAGAPRHAMLAGTTLSRWTDIMLICPHYLKNRREGTFDGVTKYTDELIRSLARFDPPLRLHLSRLGTGRAYYLDALTGFFAHRLEARRKRPRLVHTLDWYIPRVERGTPHVVTVHDLIMLGWTGSTRAWKSRVYLQSLRAADHYIAISGSVARALQAQLDIPAERITVVHHGVNPLFFEQRRVYSEAEKDIDLLFVSNIMHRKNLAPLLATVERLSRLGRPARLVIIGRILEEEAPVLAQLEALRQRGLVELRSGLSEDELADTYARARVFISCSLEEGFGMPALEAMATGLPVALSAIPVYREIAGDHAVFFDPRSEDELFRVVDTLLGDAGRRQRIAAQNRAYSRQFSWDQCAERTLAVYERLL